jgi:hypothetical protein
MLFFFFKLVQRFVSFFMALNSPVKFATLFFLLFVLFVLFILFFLLGSREVAVSPDFDFPILDRDIGGAGGDAPSSGEASPLPSSTEEPVGSTGSAVNPYYVGFAVLVGACVIGLVV